MSRRAVVCAVAAATVAAACAGTGTPDTSPAQRRMELLQRTRSGSVPVPVLVQALEDENVIVRRTAARLLGELGEPAASALRATQEDSDALVRRTGLMAICRQGGVEALPVVDQALSDSRTMVRLVAVQYLESVQPRTETTLALLDRAGDDPDDKVREIATRATWPFFRESTSIRDRQDVDRDVTVAQTIPLPKDGWRFAREPLRITVEEGRMVEMTGPPPQMKRLEAFIASGDPPADAVDEVGILTTTLEENDQYYWSDGTHHHDRVHIALGNNVRRDVVVHGPKHADTEVHKPTIRIDGRVVVEDGIWLR